MTIAVPRFETPHSRPSRPRRGGVTVLPKDCANCVNFSLMSVTLAVAALFATLLATPVQARDSLGIFSDWAAFRDPATPRCYAIAMAQPSSLQREFQPYADIGTWPRQQARGQVHIRLSRRPNPQQTRHRSPRLARTRTPRLCFAFGLALLYEGPVAG